jgi:hypothetical protein
MNKTGRAENRFYHAPYAGLPFLVFGIFVLCFALYPGSPIFSHHLRDPDHYMRLNQVIAWIQGQSWYDLSVPRMSPGAGTIIHWARLIDIPIAGVSLPLIPLLGVTHAVFVAALIVPFFWFGLLLALLTLLAKPFVGEGRARLATLALVFMPSLLVVYAPGNVDHHGAQVLVAGFGLLSLVRMIGNDKASLFAVLAGLAFACGFWIGAEIVPWAIMFMACLGLAAALHGEAVARSAAIFGIALPVFTALLVPIALPPEAYSSLALSWFSPAYVVFAALAGGTFVAGEFATQLVKSAWGRLSVYGLLGLAAALVFAAFVPTASSGPFADYNAFDQTTALENIAEAQPLVNALRLSRFNPVTMIVAFGNFVHALALPLVALGVCLLAAAKTRREKRTIWLAQGLFLIAAMSLTLFWQIRVGKFMDFFALIPLTYLLTLWGNTLKEKTEDIPGVLFKVALILVLGPMSAGILPALRSLSGDSAVNPPLRRASTCKLEPVIPFLLDLKHMETTKPLIIMNSGDTGPQLLFSTPHSVVAGNFNVPGNKDAHAFFSAKDDVAALAAAKKWGADTVLVCDKVPTLYTGKDYYSLKRTQLTPGKDGLLRFENKDPDQPLIQRLVKGEIPSWLRPIEIYGASDYLLYRIDYPEGH